MIRGVVLGLAALALAGSEQAVLAQGIGLRGATGDVGSEFDGRWARVQDTEGSHTRQFREWIRLRFGGWVLDPGILDFDLDFSPQFNQDLFKNPSTSSTGDGTILNGGAAVRLLSARRLSLRAYFLRSARRHTGVFGSDTDSDQSAWGVEVSDRNPYLPLSFEYRVDSDDTRFTTASSPEPVRTNLRTRLLQLTARNSKTYMVFQRHVQEDRVLDIERIRSLARLQHTLRWGKGSRLSSQVERWKNSGGTESDGISVSEGVILMHRTNLFSNLSYSYARTATPRDVQYQNLGQVGTTYLIARGIQTSVDGLGNWQRTRSGTHRSTYRVGSRLTLRRELPLGTSANASGRAGHQWLEQGSDNGLVDVVDERHPIGETESFRLNESFAEPATVLVRREDGFLYEPGIDYRIVDVGPFIEIVLLPGGRIQVGETVLVDYQFRLVPGASTRSLTWGYGLNLDLGPVRLYHNRAVEDALDEEPEDALLGLRDYDERLFGAGIDLSLSSLSFSAQAEYRAVTLEGFDSDSRLVSGALGVNPSRRLSMSLRGSLIAQRGGDLPVDILRAESSLAWNLLRGLDVRAGLSYSSWRELDRHTDFLGGGLGVTARWRQLTLETRVDRRAWSNGADRSENRVFVRLVRRL